MSSTATASTIIPIMLQNSRLLIGWTSSSLFSTTGRYCRTSQNTNGSSSFGYVFIFCPFVRKKYRKELLFEAYRFIMNLLILSFNSSEECFYLFMSYSWTTKLYWNHWSIPITYGQGFVDVVSISDFIYQIPLNGNRLIVVIVIIYVSIIY